MHIGAHDPSLADGAVVPKTTKQSKRCRIEASAKRDSLPYVGSVRANQSSGVAFQRVRWQRSEDADQCSLVRVHVSAQLAQFGCLSIHASDSAHL